jgi:predicted ATPase/DNA-binding CsgD family transcriptional regulator
MSVPRHPIRLRKPSSNISSIYTFYSLNRRSSCNSQRLTTEQGEYAKEAIDKLCSPSSSIVTLVGNIGVGKSHIAHIVAENSKAYFSSIVIIDFQFFDDPSSLPVLLARALNLSAHGNLSVIEKLALHTNNHRLLIVLDNFDMIRDSWRLVQAIVQSVPTVRILITAQHPLGIRNEAVIIVRPLSLPNSNDLGGPVLEGDSVVQLFAEHAKLVEPSFAVTAKNSRDVIALCRVSGGLPASINLLASMYCHAVIAPPKTKNSDLIATMSAGKHYELQDLISMALDFLTDSEIALFRRLSIFVGSAPIEAIQWTCNQRDDLGSDILGLVISLFELGLIHEARGSTDGPRFYMPRHVRNIAIKTLLTSGEYQSVADAHAKFYLTQSRVVSESVYGPLQKSIFDQIDLDLTNYRVAIAHFEECGRSIDALELSANIFRFWEVRGPASEGFALLDRLLVDTEDLGLHQVRIDALNVFSYLAIIRRSFGIARDALDEAMSGSIGLCDEKRIAHTLVNLSILARIRGDYTASRKFLVDGLKMVVTQLKREGEWDFRDPKLARSAWLLSHGLANAGHLWKDQGRIKAAKRLYKFSLTIREHLGDTIGIANLCQSLGEASRLLGDSSGAVKLHTTCLEVRRGVGYSWGEFRAHLELAHDYREILKGIHKDDEVAHRDYAERCKEHYHRSLLGFRSIGYKTGMAAALEGIACLYIGENSSLLGVQAAAAADVIRTAAGQLAPQSLASEVRAHLASARRSLGASVFETAWLNGVASDGEGLELLVEGDHARFDIDPRGTKKEESYAVPTAQLTKRESEVIECLVLGMSDREIASELSMSMRTASTHLARIYRRIGVHSRSEAIEWAKSLVSQGHPESV